MLQRHHHCKLFAPEAQKPQAGSTVAPSAPTPEDAKLKDGSGQSEADHDPTSTIGAEVDDKPGGGSSPSIRKPK
jgi:hypothetical protein